MDIQEIIKTKQRAMLPTRLLRGAEILGNLWRSGVRCSGGWGSACSCPQATDFCTTKDRWVALYVEYVGTKNQGPIDVLQAMSVRQFEATGLTVLVLVPGSEIPIRVGKNGTLWQTISDLGALEGTTDYGPALQAVLNIQKVMR